MKVDPRLHQILDRLRAVLPDLRARYAVDTLEVFGSRVRGDVGARSDIDILVTFTPDLFTFIALEDELSNTLGSPVDLVMRRSLKPRLRDRILAEAVPV
jgi:predicted nucleotidyltransferase